MKDGLGREIDYLRISLTDKCNLRCGYCMPSDGIQHMDHSEVLSLEEMGRLVRIMTGLGIKRVRLTGGEPLVRRGVMDFIRMLKSEYGIGNISMTSNGIMLAEKYTGRYGGMDDIQSECSVAEGLKRAGRMGGENVTVLNLQLVGVDKEKNVGVPRKYLRNINVRWFFFDLSDFCGKICLFKNKSHAKFERIVEKQRLKHY